ncbi:MAG: YdbL family protein [Alphaproteobacteria bacterium]
MCATVGIPFQAGAQERPLDAPRAQGIVGERFDGLAVIRQPAAAGGLESVVADINAKRQALYQRRASSEGVPVTEIGKIYAKEIFRSAPAGTWFLQENGSWIQK